ncbi:MAG: hypothetical protein HYT76_06115 [Deltaproteobacteria bacterium]|nr:hypothetical protein [Deltaproteobacteria bacterium]
MKKNILLLLSLLYPLSLGASPCWKASFDWNEKKEAREHRLALLPFENESALRNDEWLQNLFPSVLYDYLNLSRKTEPVFLHAAPESALFNPTEALKVAREAKADFLILGQFSRTGPILQVTTRLLQVSDGTEAGRFNGKVEFPGTRTMNDFLVEIADQASRKFKAIGLSTKKLTPYRNETISSEALRFYVLGSLALHRGTKGSVLEAIRRFEESVRQDYNYVPAYLGLSLALARQGFIETTEGYPSWRPYVRARRELEKGRLLHRPKAEQKEKEVEPYLEAETYYKLAESYAKEGKTDRAIKELKKLVKILPGDFASRERLVDLLKQTGQTAKIQEQEEAVNQLTRCEGE